jgi:hypothetical protein
VLSLDTLTARSPEPVVLLAAHYQPEVTSFPEGGELGNHIDIVIKLRSIGYKGVIAYREHYASVYYQAPFIHQTRVGMTRSVRYFQRLEEMGCAFIDNVKPLPLEASARFVPLTITGTIAVERSLAGLKTIVTGYPWYGDLPGGVILRDATSWDLLDCASAPSASLAGDAFAHLDRALSRTTILNAPGIGSGIPMNDTASVETFSREFGSLLEQLQQK